MKPYYFCSFIVLMLLVGCSKPDSNVLSSQGNLVADFSASSTTTKPSEAIQFTDRSQGNPTSWLWDFGDGTTSKEQNPLKAFTKTGTYSVKLTISKSSANNQSISKSIVLAPLNCRFHQMLKI